MGIYINGLSAISPQPFFEGDRPFCSTHSLNSDYLSCIEPDYNTILDSRLIRRMSRIIKMGMATGLEAIKDAYNVNVDAIITGTGFGCIEDTSQFLGKMIDPKNRMMNPTSFIQSTHNTVGAQLSLHLKVMGYNNTFVHSGFAFENALDDAILLINNGDAQNILIGGIDEQTKDLSRILKLAHASLNRKLGINEFTLYPFGEGSSFFILSNTPNNKSVEISNFITLYKPSQTKLDESINKILENNPRTLFFLGKNGHSLFDKSYHWLESAFSNHQFYSYKKLCGEYPTASAFGLWLAASLLKGDIAKEAISNEIPSNIIIYNCFEKDYHSFISLKKC